VRNSLKKADRTVATEAVGATSFCAATHSTGPYFILNTESTLLQAMATPVKSRIELALTEKMRSLMCRLERLPGLPNQESFYVKLLMMARR
jgi:hypothetical protein